MCSLKLRHVLMTRRSSYWEHSQVEYSFHHELFDTGHPPSCQQQNKLLPVYPKRTCNKRMCNIRDGYGLVKCRKQFCWNILVLDRRGVSSFYMERTCKACVVALSFQLFFWRVNRIKKAIQTQSLSWNVRSTLSHQKGSNSIDESCRKRRMKTIWSMVTIGEGSSLFSLRAIADQKRMPTTERICNTTAQM